MELGADVDAAGAELEDVLEAEDDEEEAEDRDADDEALAELELALALELTEAELVDALEALELTADPVAPEMTNAGEKLTLLLLDESTIWKLYAAPLRVDPAGMVKVADPADAATVARDLSADVLHDTSLKHTELNARSRRNNIALSESNVNVSTAWVGPCDGERLSLLMMIRSLMIFDDQWPCIPL